MKSENPPLESFNEIQQFVKFNFILRPKQLSFHLTYNIISSILVTNHGMESIFYVNLMVYFRAIDTLFKCMHFPIMYF